MAEKTLNARVITKNDTKANWDKATNFVPKKGELIVYTDLLKVKVGDGETVVTDLPYANETGSVHLVEGPATDTTAGTWTGSIDCLTEYYDGLTLIYVPKVAGANTTTLNINGLGAKKCIRQASSNLTTHYGTGTAIMFVYRSSLDGNKGGWQTLAIYDTTDVSMLRSNHARYYVGDYPLYRYKLCAIDSKERLQPLTLENTTAATKTQTSIAFKPDMLYYFNQDATIAANTIVSASTVYYSYYMTTGTYTFNATVPTYHTIYLVGSLDLETGLFTLDQTDKTSWYKFVPYNNTFTKNEDYFVEGKYYIYVGRSYSTNNYYSLEVCNPLYYFDGHNLVQTNTAAERALAKTDTNQTVKVGTTTFGSNDAVEIVAGENVTITPDAGTKKITISAEVPEGDSYLYSYLNVDYNKPCVNLGTTWHWGYYLSGAEIPFNPTSFKPIMLKKIKYNNVIYSDGTCRGVVIESNTNHNKAIRFDIQIGSVWRTVALVIYTANPNPSSAQNRYSYQVLMSYGTEWDLIQCNEIGIVFIDITLDGDIQLSGQPEIYIEIPDEPVVETITFTISGTPYTAAQGMTWGEWLISKYNTSSIAFKWPATTGAAITTPVGDYLYNTNYEEQTLVTQIQDDELYLIE